ncbi:MAG: DMT family transporter [Verrucomicrobiota bacterium JB022]|nr:DMT family transporter [Verrucomicrobiota bacterium JB022]
METSVFYALAVVAALIYTVASLLQKQALEFHVGAMRVLFVSHWLFWLCVLPAGLLAPGQVDGSLWWAVLVTGLLSSAGATFSVLAIKYGDVSVAMPLMGIKVLAVAVLSAIFLAQPVPLAWWLAAVLTVVAVYLLGRRRSHSGKSVWLTVLLATLASLTYAGMDVMFGAFAQRFGFFQFVAAKQTVVVASSFVLLPFFSGPLRSIPVKAFRWIVPAVMLMAVQFYMMTYSVSASGDPTAINILYSSRGMWSVLLVALVGHWFDNRESHVGRTVMIERFVGAGLLLVAIGIVMVTGN